VQLLNSQLDTSFLTEIFPEVSFSFFQSNDSQRFISCFVARFADNDKCAECWRRITNRIAVDFQEELSNSFASWNIYLALVTPHQVDRHLKYRIENDRFALRKLMFSGREYFEGSDGPILSILEDSNLASPTVALSRMKDPTSFANIWQTSRPYLQTERISRHRSASS
jgi:hypothetical protein